MCDICCGEYQPTFFFHLPGCSHSYCKNCMSDHLKTKITDGQVLKIKCMDFDCTEEFNQEDIKNFGSEEIYRKYLVFKKNIDVEVDRNLKWCPKNGCMNYVKRKRSCCCYSNTQKCECGQLMCFKCGAASHRGVSCKNVGN